MILRRARRDAGLMLLLFVLPALAHLPAWWAGRLLGPGDGAAMHYPLRVAAWRALRAGEWPAWNDGIFLGTPLLAAYRPGALYPPMALLAFLPEFIAFQLLVFGSLGAAGVTTFLYLRRLGAEHVGAFVGGLCFALGPYLVAHLGDTATVVASPLLPLLLLATESHVNNASPARAAGLAASLALLLLAGSPEATRAGAALLAGRLSVGLLLARHPRSPRPRATLVAVGAGLLLAAPQLLPTLVAARDAGPAVTGLPEGGAGYPGLFGLVLRYVSHTPAGALALAALPLALTRMPVRVLGVSLAICLALQWGRGPLAAPGALALVFDLALAIVAGLSLSEQWRARRSPLGARLRALFLLAALASAAALSVAAAVVAPLPETLAGAVGVLALSLILYFSLAGSPDPLRAAVWLLPLVVSFLLQPTGRGAWADVPTRDDLEPGSATAQALRRTMGELRGARALALVPSWPRGQERDLSYGNWAALAGGRSANGYDPMVAVRTRALLGDMSAGGILPGPFFRSDPARVSMLGVRWLMVPDAALVPQGAGDPIELTMGPSERRFFPVSMRPMTEVRLVSMLSEATDVPQETVVAVVSVRLATGRSFALPIRAGVHTAEWAWDREDVRARVAHAQPEVAESWPDPGGFMGHRYRARLALPGRYLVDGLLLETSAGAGELTVSRLSVADERTGRMTAVSLPAAFVSDTRRFAERAATPNVRLYEVVGGARAWVAGGRRVMRDAKTLLNTVGSLTRAGIDPHAEALVEEEEARGWEMPPRARAGRADIVRATGPHVDVRAEGPGLLVLAEGWDLGWRAHVDDAAATIHRVNHAEMGVVLGPGLHRIVFRYRPPGFTAGLVAAALAAVALAAAQRGVAARIRHLTLRSRAR